MRGMVSLLLLGVGMKQILRILVLLLLVPMLASCETLFLEEASSSGTDSKYNNSQQEKQNDEEKFLGTWVYSDKNFGETAKKLDLKGWSSDSKLELAFSFRPDNTGTFSRITSSNGMVNEEQQEFIWYYDTSYLRRVWAVMQDNTAESYTLLYENELFLTINSTDLGTMFFAKQQQEAIEQ